MKMAPLKSVLIIAIAVLMLLALPAINAEAGFVSINAVPVGEVPGHGPPDFVWGLLPDESGNAQAVLNELFSPELGDEYAIRFSGITNGDPVLTLTKSIVNNTGITWVGYEIDLDPLESATFVGTPTSDKFTLVGQTATSLDFGLPAPVANGESVNFTMDISIPNVGPFGFTLSQSPVRVPEPTSAALVILAASFVIGSWRNRCRA
jgi:hypothetical protein